jgi:hypothetical protein
MNRNRTPVARKIGQIAIIRALHSEKLLIQLHIEQRPQKTPPVFVYQSLTTIGKDRIRIAWSSTSGYSGALNLPTMIAPSGDGEQAWL